MFPYNRHAYTADDAAREARVLIGLNLSKYAHQTMVGTIDLTNLLLDLLSILTEETDTANA